MKKYILMTVLSTLSFICHAQRYEVGTTTATWKNPVVTDFMKAEVQGVHYIGVALSQCYREVPVEEMIPRIKLVRSRVDSAGVQVWSIHLPSFRTLDVLILDGSLHTKNVRFMAQMIEQRGQFKPARLILYPSSEPIADSVRARCIVNTQHSIMHLKLYADCIETRLCIESLPHTCLGNTPEELLEIICGVPGMKVCFDTNHYNRGSIRHSMKMLSRHIETIRASDFDLVSESHWLPTQGEVDWQRFVKKLRSSGYKGIFVYEAVKDCDHGKARPVPSHIYETLKSITGSE